MASMVFACILFKERCQGVESSVELLVGREVLRAGLTSLRASFTVSHQGEYLASCVGFCVCCLGRFFCLFAVCATRYFPFFGV